MHFKYYHILTAGVIIISLLFYSRFIPSLKEEWHYILLAIPAAEIRQNMWNCYAFWSMLTIAAIWISFHKLHRKAPVRSSEKTRQRIARFWTTKHECSAYFRSHFCIPGVKGNSSIHCWSVQDVCLLQLDEKMIFLKCVPIYSNFIEFLRLKGCVLVLGMKQTICFLLNCLSFMQSLIVRIPWTN